MNNKDEIPKRRKDRKEGGKSKRAKKRERQAAEELEEERRLTSLLFGTDDEPTGYSEPPKQTQTEEKSSSLFEIDRIGDSVEHPDDVPGKDLTKDDKDEGFDETDNPVWQDDDDEEVSVNLLNTNRLRKLRKSRTEAAASALSGSELENRLRTRYQKSTQVGARTDWANISGKRSQEDLQDEQNKRDETDFQDTSEPLLLGASAQSRLPPNILNTMRCPDANQSDPNQAVVQAVHFHPGSDPDSPLLLTAGFDKTLRFFQVGTEKSEKIHGIHCKSYVPCRKNLMFQESVLIIRSMRLG